MSIKQKIDELVQESKVILAEEVESTEPETSTESEIVTETKLDVSADVDALLNGEDLSEEFKTKAATIFEAAVMTRVKAEVLSLEESFASKLEEEKEVLKNGLIDHIDGFLNVMVEQWMEDNEVALESGIKNEISEKLITGLHSLFTENYIEVPESKIDLVAGIELELAEKTKQLEEALSVNVNLNKTINEEKREALVSNFSKDLTDVDAGKFRDLVEELSFESIDTFEGKLKTIKENYFTKKSGLNIIKEVLISDDPVEENGVEKTEEISPIMARYVNQLKQL